MYAIVRTGGKQYRVEAGRTVTVDRLQAEEGATVELGDILLIADDGDVTVGAPRIEGARVLATVEEQGRHKKITVFKYKAKVRTRKKTGHRQRFTRLAVEEILRPGEEPKAKAKPKRRRRRKTAEEAPTEEPVAEAPAEAEVPTAEAPAPEEEEKPKRRTRRKKAEVPTAEAPPESEAEVQAKPKRRRTTRKKAEEPTAEAPPAAEAEAKPKRRTRRKKAEETE